MHRSLPQNVASSQHLQRCRCPALASEAEAAAAARRPQRGRLGPVRRAVERDLDWDPAIRKGPVTAPGRGAPPPPPPPPEPKTGLEWLETPFRSRRNIVLTTLLGSAAVWVWNKKVLPPVAVGEPPADFPFRLAGFTDVAPEDFVYARTPAGNWVAAAQDEAGRVFLIDQAGDLYYDTGNPEVGIYALDPQGNLFNIYQDENRQRRITPVGNVSQLQKFKISEIAGVKLDRDVNVVAMADGSDIPLPPSAGAYDSNGKFVPPGELIEGFSLPPPDNPFARLLGRPGAGPPVNRFDVDLADPRPYDRQLYDQTLLDDPDLPGAPALPPNFSLEDFARRVEEEQQERGRRKRGLF